MTRVDCQTLSLAAEALFLALLRLQQTLLPSRTLFGVSAPDLEET